MRQGRRSRSLRTRVGRDQLPADGPDVPASGQLDRYRFQEEGQDARVGDGHELAAGEYPQEARCAPLIVDRLRHCGRPSVILPDDLDAHVPEAVGPGAEARLGTGPDRFRDVRIQIVREDDRGATAVAEAIHYERRASSFLGVFAGSELVPVADARVLSLLLEAVPVELPGGGDIGTVRWELVAADAGS